MSWIIFVSKLMGFNLNMNGVIILNGMINRVPERTNIVNLSFMYNLCSIML